MLLKGTNIRLRDVDKNDLDVLYMWENDKSVWSVSNTHQPYSRETLAEYISAITDIYTDKQLRLVITLNNGHSIGLIDLFDYDHFHRRAGIGILIADENYRKKGFATEALSVLLQYCNHTLRLINVYCSILEDNPASIRLFEKSGFVCCGQKNNWHFNNNSFLSEYSYQLTFINNL